MYNSFPLFLLEYWSMYSLFFTPQQQALQSSTKTILISFFALSSLLFTPPVQFFNSLFIAITLNNIQTWHFQTSIFLLIFFKTISSFLFYSFFILSVALDNGHMMINILQSQIFQLDYSYVLTSMLIISFFIIPIISSFRHARLNKLYKTDFQNTVYVRIIIIVFSFISITQKLIFYAYAQSLSIYSFTTMFFASRGSSSTLIWHAHIKFVQQFLIYLLFSFRKYAISMSAYVKVYDLIMIMKIFIFLLDYLINLIMFEGTSFGCSYVLHAFCQLKVLDALIIFIS